MKKSIKRKSLVSIFLWFIYGLSYKIFYPILTNNIAVQQLEDSSESFVNYQLYQTIWNNLWIVLILITILIFKKDIGKIFKNLK